MARKLITFLLTLTIIACSSISIYATTESIPQNDEVTEAVTTEVTDTEQEVIEQNQRGSDSEEAEKTEEEIEAGKEAAKEAAKAAAAKKKAEKYKRGLAAYIRYINPNVSKSKAREMAGHFIEKGKKYKVDEKVLMAIAQNESTFYEKAKSPYGYKGLMQTSDALARANGYKPSSLLKAEVSITVGAKYLGSMKKMFGTYTKAVSAYAYGSGSVKSGNYSTALAQKVLNTRKNITRYLERNRYI